MKTKHLFLFFSMILYAHSSALGQKENNIWAFGNRKGIDFNSTPPIIINTAMSSVEGCSSACDPSTGNLLFYSNGLTVWDRTNIAMPNGTGLLGAKSMSSTQGTAIAPVDGYPNLYYLFTLDDYSPSRSIKLRYSLIDMSLNSGKGDIVTGKKNILLDSNLSEKMIVAPACKGIWLIVHHVDSPIFYSYKVNSAPIGAPVKSKTAGLTSPYNYSVGTMRLSTDFKNIVIGNYAVTTTVIPRIELFDFDVTTGIVGGYNFIDSMAYAYNIELSPDKSKLYVIDFDKYIYQYDLSLLPSISAVRASKYQLDSKTQYWSLRRGPDGKIYVLNGADINKLSRINEPDKAGIACNFEVNVPSLTSIDASYYLDFGNNTCQPLTNLGDTQTTLKDTTICQGRSISYTGDASHTSYMWNDGDTSRNRNITDQGTYWRFSVENCNIFIDTFIVRLKGTDTTYSSKDTIVCFAPQVTLTAQPGFASYIWNDGSPLPAHSFYTSGAVWVQAFDYGCHSEIDTTKITFTDFNLNIPDTFICRDKTVNLNATTANATQYRWQDNSNLSSFTAIKDGTYWVEVSVGACKKTDTINIVSRTFNLNLGTDQTICKGDSILLKSTIDNGTYLWQNGSVSPSIWAKENGIYTLKVTFDGCTEEDSVTVETVKCTACITIPNAFTPNGDTKNDGFKALTFCPTLQYKIIIVNRYGQEIFTSDNPNEEWDGTFKNTAQDIGTYYYLIKVKFNYPDSKEELYKGDISLIR